MTWREWYAGFMPEKRRSTCNPANAPIRLTVPIHDDILIVYRSKKQRAMITVGMTAEANKPSGDTPSGKYFCNID